MTFLPAATARDHGQPLARLLAVAELVVLAVFALAAARLFWIALTPTGPLGDWQGAVPRATAASAVPGSDPFSRAAPVAEGVTVSGLDLMLVGTRMDMVSGRGSAIIALPGGQQQSVAVGEAVQPGVTLVAVDFDSVTLRNGGVDEKLFLDQSSGAAPVQPSGAAE